MYKEESIKNILRCIARSMADIDAPGGGKSVPADMESLSLMATLSHMIMIRNGRKYAYNVSENSYEFLDEETGEAFSVSKDALAEFLTESELSGFDREIKEDGRLIGELPEDAPEPEPEDIPEEDKKPEEYPEEEPEPDELPETEIQQEEKPEEEPDIEPEPYVQEAPMPQYDPEPFVQEEAPITEKLSPEPPSLRPAPVTDDPYEGDRNEEFLRQVADTGIRTMSMSIPEPGPVDAQKLDRDLSHIMAGISRKAGIADKYTDRTKIEKEELLQYYAAFTLTMDDQVGRYELMAAPLDPKNPTGRFAFWVLKYNSDKAYVNVSKTTDRSTEEGVYRFFALKDNLSIRMEPEIQNGRFRIRITLQGDDSAYITIKREKTIGDSGHILFVDEESEIAIHVFPLDMTNNNEGNAGFFYVTETEDEAKASIIQDGSGTVKTPAGNYQMTARWKGDTLLVQLI